MKIQMLNRDGVAAPYVLCDSCGRPIIRDDGLATWTEIPNGEVTMVHSGACDQKGGGPLFEHLDVFLDNLRGNAIGRRRT